MLATECFGRPVERRAKRTLPGAAARARLEVNATTRTVPILLALNGSLCTTSTGRRKPGSEPLGAFSDAHLKRTVMGREVVVAVTDGKLDFGPWECIFYGEFDGKRKKRVLVKIIGE